MKPVWFYEFISMASQNSVSTALRAFDATLLDEVKVNIEVRSDYDLYVDDYTFSGRSFQTLNNREAQVTITDAPPPNTKKRFITKDFLAYPESIIIFAKDMNPDEGQYRPFVLFQAMFEDEKFPQIHLSHRMGSDNRMVYQHGFWERSDEWFLVKPTLLNYSTKNDQNRRGII